MGTKRGSAGGLAVFRKYGREHFVALGKLGARKHHQLYQWVPAGTAGWAIVRRADGVRVALVAARPY